MSPGRASPSLFTRLVACVQYGLVSTSITLFNRAVFSVYHFNFPNFVTSVQILVSIAFIYGLRAAGVIKTAPLTRAGARRVRSCWALGRRQGRPRRALPRRALAWRSHLLAALLPTRPLLQVAPLTLFWWLYVVSGVTALRYLNVPMFSVLRRSTTLLVVLGEFWVFGKRPAGASAVRGGPGGCRLPTAAAADALPLLLPLRCAGSARPLAQGRAPAPLLPAARADGDGGRRGGGGADRPHLQRPRLRVGVGLRRQHRRLPPAH